jgi:leucyl/phenylalanyl-tRNA--protein transferase
MLSLVERLKSQGAEFIDCQMQNSHLASLGCIEVPRAQFLSMLAEQKQQKFDHDVWQPQILKLTQWL